MELTGITSLFKIISLGLAAIFASLGFGTPGKTFSPTDAENIKANIAVFSDTHVEGNNPTRQLVIAKGLDDVANSASKVDALVITGDCTMNGQGIEYFDLLTTLKVHNRTDKTFLVMGNHDACNRPGGFAEADRRFRTYQGLVNGDRLEKPYYSSDVNGYKMIFMSTESDKGTEQYISDEQLEWLDAQLKEGTKDGMPVFVFNHNPIKGTNNVNSIWPTGSMGEQSADVLNTLRKYANVFFFSGHMHTDIDRNGVYTNDLLNPSLHFVDCPLFSNTSKFNGNEVCGVGYQVEVYEHSVVLRGRSFETSEWLVNKNGAEFQAKIPLIPDFELNLAS